MIKNVAFGGTQICVADEGRGDAVLLLHGYLETMDIWNGFYEQLLSRYRVVRFDVPGHGKSGVIAETHTMDLLAEAVEAVVVALGITRCVIVGHSMGGYIAMACMARHPAWLSGVCLFHSSPLADDDKKRRARDKEIRLVSEGKLSLIGHFSIPNAFAEENLRPLAEKVFYARELAQRSSEAGVTAILRGMRDRPDRLDTLRNTALPLLFILGRHDTYVNCDETAALAASLPTAETLVLERAAHSAYYEEPEKSMQALLSFLERAFFHPQQ